jgi:TonB family protein
VELRGLQPGDEVLVYADLPRDRPFDVQLDGPQGARHTVATAEVTRPLLERAWVNARIQRLGHQRDTLAGADEDLREALKKQIVELSTRHRVMSDYTALLVLETEADYARFNIDRRALADIMMVGANGIDLLNRRAPGYQIAAPPPSAIEQEARTRGVLGVLGGPTGGKRGGLANLVGRDGAPPLGAAGGLTGNQVGDSFGSGGLGLRGTGQGGGGAGEGTIGLGNLGTVGHGGGSGAGRGLGGAPAGRPAAPAAAPPAEIAADTAAAAPAPRAEAAKPAAAARPMPEPRMAKEAKAEREPRRAAKARASDEEAPRRPGAGYGSGLGRRQRVTGIPYIQEGQPTVRGSLDTNIIRRVIRAHVAEVRACYERQLRVNPGLSGRVTLQLVIGPQGDVVNVQRQSTTMSSPPLDACLIATARRWRFPAPAGGGAVMVTYPFTFQPAGGTETSWTPPPPAPPPPPPAPIARGGGPQATSTIPYEGKLLEVMTLLKRGQAKQALGKALVWREEQPGDVLALVALGEALEALGQRTWAARAYGSLIDLFPSRADLRRFAGERLDRLGLKDPAALALAVDTYQKAVKPLAW